MVLLLGFLLRPLDDALKQETSVLFLSFNHSPARSPADHITPLTMAQNDLHFPSGRFPCSNSQSRLAPTHIGHLSRSHCWHENLTNTTFPTLACPCRSFSPYLYSNVSIHLQCSIASILSLHFWKSGCGFPQIGTIPAPVGVHIFDKLYVKSLEKGCECP